MPGIDGMRKRAPMGAGIARQRMWNSMRRLRQFSVAEIVATAEVSTSNAGVYTRRLAREGYLRVATPKREGVVGGHTVYALVRDTGPYAPRIAKDRLRDPNLETAERGPADKPVSVPRAEYERALCCVRACAGMADPEAEVSDLKRRAGGDA